jgi:hypothetical protein
MPNEPDVAEKNVIPTPRGYEKVIANWTRVVGIATLASFLASAVSAYVLYKTDLTLGAQSENARAQIRAYVGASGSKVSGSVAKKGDTDFTNVQLTLAFKNFGATPAKFLDVWYWSGWFQNSAEPDFTKPPTPLVPVPLETLSAGAETFSDPMSISLADIAKMRDNNGRIFVWGQIKYHDVFPNSPPRTMRYCYIATMPLKVNDPTALKRYNDTCNISD